LLLIQNGRRSASKETSGEHAITHVQLKPPRHFDDDEKEFFFDLLASCTPGQFIPSDMPVLANYVEVSVAMRRAKVANDVSAWQKFTNMQCRLGVKLRLVPSTRIGRKKNGRLARKAVERVAVPATPWE
jgi:hypothetical protein